MGKHNRLCLIEIVILKKFFKRKMLLELLFLIKVELLKSEILDNFRFRWFEISVIKIAKAASTSLICTHLN